MAPALAVGCTIVMKPSEITPLTALVSPPCPLGVLSLLRVTMTLRFEVVSTAHTASMPHELLTQLSTAEPSPGLRVSHDERLVVDRRTSA